MNGWNATCPPFTQRGLTGKSQKSLLCFISRGLHYRPGPGNATPIEHNGAHLTPINPLSPPLRERTEGERWTSDASCGPYPQTHLHNYGFSVLCVCSFTFFIRKKQNEPGGPHHFTVCHCDCSTITSDSYTPSCVVNMSQNTKY